MLRRLLTDSSARTFPFMTDEAMPPLPVAPALLGTSSPSAADAFRGRVAPCPQCGYDRRGLPRRAPCPECSAPPIPAEAIVLPMGTRRPVGWGTRALRLATALALAIAGVLFAVIIPNPTIAVAFVVIAFTGCLLFASLAVRPRAARQGTALFSVGGVTQQVAGVTIRTSWRDISAVTSKGEVITLRPANARRHFATGLGTTETAEVAAAIGVLRAAAAAHPDASPPTRAIAAYQVCPQCGALRPTDSTAGRCVVCGEPDPADLRRRVFGRSSPRALQHALLRQGVWTLAYAALGVTLLWLGSTGLKVVSVVPFWLASVYLRSLRDIAATRRNFLDRVWIVLDDRVVVVAGRRTESVGWARAGELSVGPSVNGWSRLRLEQSLGEENPAEIWVDVQRESIEEICAAIGAARTLSSHRLARVASA